MARATNVGEELPKLGDASAATGDLAYKAFISYSHAADGRLAPALQSGLHRFAKPWYRLRAMRVFRDETTLSASPELWPSIESALSQSEFFLFLASPEAAESFWVRKEFEYWVTNRSKNRMLIVLTDGDLAWDRESTDFDWSRTTSIPRDVEHGFQEEPLYVDLRWAKTEDHLSLRNLRFRSAIADVASTLLGRPKDELIGEDVRQHRRTRRITWSAIAALVSLTVLSVVAAFIAIKNQKEAERQQRVAEDRLRLSQSRQLAAQARNELLAGRLDLALLLGTEAFRPLESLTEKNPADSFDARNAMLQAMQTNPRLDAYLGRAETIGDISFSPDGTLIAVATSRNITFWDPSTLRPSGKSVEGPGDAVFKIAFSPDGHLLAVGSRGKNRLMLFDVAGRQRVHPPLAAQEGAIAALAFSPDGKILISGAGDGSIMFWDVDSGQPIGNPLKAHNSNVESLAVNPKGTVLATGSWDNTSILWDLQTREPIFPALDHGGQVEAVAFSPDGKVLATASANTVTFWDVDTGKPVGRKAGHQGKVDTLAFNNDGTILAIGGAGSNVITLWDVTEQKPLGAPLTGHGAPISSLSFSPDSLTLASASADNSVLLWHPRQVERLAHSEGVGEQRVTSLAVSATGRFLAVGTCGVVKGGVCKNGLIRLFKLVKDSPVTPLRPQALGPPLSGHLGAVQTLAFNSADHTLVSSGCADFRGTRCLGAEVRRWDTSTFEASDPISVLENTVTQTMQLDLEGLALAVSHGDIQLFDTLRLQPMLNPLTGLKSLALDIGFDPRGRMLAASSLSDDVIVWERHTGLQPFQPLEGRRVVFDGDGKTLVTIAKSLYGPNRLIIWDSNSGERIRETTTASHEVILSLAISPNGRLAAFGDTKGNIILWDLEADQPLGLPLGMHTGGVGELLFVDGDKALVSADTNGVVAAWDLDLESWLHQACRIANRNMTYDEWVQYVGEEPYRLTCPAIGVDPSLLQAGQNLAAAGDVEGATAILEHAVQLGENRVQDPRKEAIAIAVKGFVDRGTRLARVGNVDAAGALFTRAVNLEPRLELEPSIEARRLAAPFLVAQGTRLAHMGHVSEALKAYELANAYDHHLEIDAQSWFEVCRAGILGGAAKEVLDACERAVKAADQSGKFRDYLGVARALTGDTGGAIQDLEAYVTFEQRHHAGHPGSVQERRQLDYIAKVQGWIDALKLGKDPFTKVELKALP